MHQADGCLCVLEAHRINFRVKWLVLISPDPSRLFLLFCVLTENSDSLEWTVDQ